jgi:hypothetical protein
MVRWTYRAVGHDRQWPGHLCCPNPVDFAYIGSAFIATAEANAMRV